MPSRQSPTMLCIGAVRNAARHSRSRRTTRWILRIQARLRRAEIVLCTLLIALVSILGCRKAVPPRVAQPPSANNDRRLILESLAHAELDLEVLGMCGNSSVRAELKSYCQEAASQQRRENDELRSWLGTWYGVNANDLPQLNAIREERRQVLRSLERKGDLPYEFQLLLNIVSHASEAMTNSQACGAEAYRTELKEFCRATSQLRRKEGRIPEAWVCQWYRDCISKAFPPYRNQ